MIKRTNTCQALIAPALVTQQTFPYPEMSSTPNVRKPHEGELERLHPLDFLGMTVLIAARYKKKCLCLSCMAEGVSNPAHLHGGPSFEILSVDIIGHSIARSANGPYNRHIGRVINEAIFTEQHAIMGNDNILFSDKHILYLLD